MSNTQDFVNALVVGTIKYLNKLNLKLTPDEEANLRKDLFDEFEKRI
ncbi:MAG: hypothetical protein CM15mP90_5700 [Actinomycetota bacterium]|nr:MAG: hypothetical protein CM15mP90_5700 [Actinomycetota bacterium]